MAPGFRGWGRTGADFRTGVWFFETVKPGAVIGRLLAAVPLRPNGANRVDAAIGQIDGRIRFDPDTLTGLGTLAGVRAEPLLPGDRVAKVGRTTGLTRGHKYGFSVKAENNAGASAFSANVFATP